MIGVPRLVGIEAGVDRVRSGRASEMRPDETIDRPRSGTGLIQVGTGNSGSGK